MTTLTLLTKAFNQGQLKQIAANLQTAFEDLEVNATVVGNPINKWVQVEVSGEDEGVAKSYITKQMGNCPGTIENVSVGLELKGYIQKMDNPEVLKIDVGVFKPKTINAIITLAKLQEQLLGGRKVALKKIAELYGFSTDMPVMVKVNALNPESSVVEAELSLTQVEKFKNWQDSLLDRLIILGTTIDDITKTLERTRLSRDIINTEALGLFDYVLTCKLGTDATGLIPQIGRYMRNARFVVVNPKKIIGLLGE